jgi:hypothetical protein
MAGTARPVARGFAGLLAVLATVPASSPDRERSAVAFAGALRDGIAVDYTPLPSPGYALTHSEAVVDGHLEGVTEAPVYSYGDQGTDARTRGQFVVLAIRVDRVVHGSAPVSAAGVLHVRQLVGSATARELSDIMPIARVTVVVADVSVAGTVTGWPDSLPSGTPLLSAYIDGFWLQGEVDATMVGVHTNPDALAPAWGTPRTIDTFLDEFD